VSEISKWTLNTVKGEVWGKKERKEEGVRERRGEVPQKQRECDSCHRNQSPSLVIHYRVWRSSLWGGASTLRNGVCVCVTQCVIIRSYVRPDCDRRRVLSLSNTIHLFQKIRKRRTRTLLQGWHPPLAPNLESEHRELLLLG